MFIDFGSGQGFGAGGHGFEAALTGDEALLLWSIRRLAVAWPRCHAVHIALQQRFGDDGLGVEHLLRSWIGSLAIHSRRRLTIGEPACAMLMDDEAAMLSVLRHAGTGRGSAALKRLTGDNAECDDLEELAAALARLALRYPLGRARR